MPDVIILLSAAISTAVAGFVASYVVQLRQLRTEMQARVVEFAEITRRASEANTSLADKLLTIDAKVDNLDSWRTMVAVTQTQHTGWKK